MPRSRARCSLAGISDLLRADISAGCGLVSGSRVAVNRTRDKVQALWSPAAQVGAFHDTSNAFNRRMAATTVAVTPRTSPAPVKTFPRLHTSKHHRTERPLVGLGSTICIIPMAASSRPSGVGFLLCFFRLDLEERPKVRRNPARLQIRCWVGVPGLWHGRGGTVVLLRSKTCPRLQGAGSAATTTRAFWSGALGIALRHRRR